MKLLSVPLAAALLLMSMSNEVEAADPVKRPLKIEDMFKLKRVADPQISPDGKHVVYQFTTVDLEGNKSSTSLYLVTTDGKSAPKKLTNALGKKDSHPRWSPDGQTILFESNRSGASQLWTIQPFSGGEATQITKINSGASTAIWSPDGLKVAFTSSIYPEFSELPFEESDKKFAEKEKAIEENPVKAKTFTKLFYRHWDSYVEDKRSHLFVIEKTATGWSQPRNVTPGDRDAYPNSSTFSVGDDFTFTPDSKHLVFAGSPTENEAWSTNYDLCRVSITNKSTKWETLTKNPAADNGPKFSPDGKKLAYRSQKKAGYEADKWDILVVDVKPDGTFAGELQNVTAIEDISVNEFVWRTNSEFSFTADSQGSTPLFFIKIGESIDRQLAQPGSINSVSSASGALAFNIARMDAPPEVYFAGNGPTVKLSNANDILLSQLERPRPESVKVKVEGGEMQMWILKPPGFDPNKKWPVAFLVHGGPQGAWEDAWSNRWNPSLWAAQGYVVALPNPRGSTGFGQKFVDEISGDWGGKCYRDLVAGLEYVKALPYVDKDRMGSAGASFGGYMMNWFAVSPIAKDFKCLITHCSVWNFESMWGTTDELWFDEWEHQGLPWEKPGSYAEFSPHKKAKAMKDNKVPMLVIHNDYDFRCPIGQGHELFTTLQRLGVKSRFVNFPDEGHWVLKPRNSQHWHKEAFAWLTEHVKPGGQ
jgi:dipeptidyl aminopeptidase/acylaminoacyl peptidase